MTSFPGRHNSYISINITFSLSVSDKLDNKIYLLWKQQIEVVIKGHCFPHFDVNPEVHFIFFLKKIKTLVSRMKPLESNRIRYYFLESWLLLSYSSPLLTRVKVCPILGNFGNKSSIIFTLRPMWRLTVSCNCIRVLLTSTFRFKFSLIFSLP